MTRNPITIRKTCSIYVIIFVVVLLVVAAIALFVVVGPELEHRRQASIRAEQIEMQYQAGIAYQDLEDWTSAEAALKSVISEDPSYKDVQTQLKEVRHQLEAIQSTATAEALDAIAQKQVSIQATATAEIKATNEALATEYEKALGYMNIEHWIEARDALERVFEVVPNYRDVQTKLVEVEAEVAKLTPTATATPQVTSTPTPTATSTSTPVPACISPPSGMISWWPGNGNADDIWDDNDGILVRTTFAQGEVGSSFMFNGTDSNVEVPNSPNLNPSREITLAAWVHPMDGQGKYRDIISKDGEQSNRQYMIILSNINRFRAHIGVPGGFMWFDGATPVQTNRWYHVVMVYDGFTLYLYVDGELDGSRPVSGPITSTTQPLRIGGGAPPGQPAYYFNGRIDEIMVFDRALGRKEIKDIYNRDEKEMCTSK